jgi:hypothetical protein
MMVDSSLLGDNTNKGVRGVCEDTNHGVGLLAGCLVGESPKGFVCDNGGGKFSFGDNTNKGWDVVCEDKTHGVGKWMVRVRGAGCEPPKVARNIHAAAAVSLLHGSSRR